MKKSQLLYLTNMTIIANLLVYNTTLRYLLILVIIGGNILYLTNKTIISNRISDKYNVSYNKAHQSLFILNVIFHIIIPLAILRGFSVRMSIDDWIYGAIVLILYCNIVDIEVYYYIKKDYGIPCILVLWTIIYFVFR